MNDTKRCSGAWGTWGCEDSYADIITPDHMLPATVEFFGRSNTREGGLDNRCHKCKTTHLALRKFYYELAGGTEKYYDLPDKERSAIRDTARENMAAFPGLPKDNLPRSKPARKRVNTTYDRLLPKEGWVYIMDTYRYNKIGKTWEDGLRARRAEARRWGPADLVYWAWFDDAMAAEKEIHRRLKRYKVEKENVGEELFDCTVDVARDEIKKLREELEDYAREKQKVG